ncbi:hypothetical protein E4U55_001792 [Claviceps digitariae]|nr:hypothetical protein E4U55_001792 [Claviceps digitariae]
MPQKRQARGTTTSLNDLGDNGKPKKRRVSLACDACRAAREKCDGARPRCGTCMALDRPCSYTPATKKRGVQTGYLRTIELSLAWLFDQIPESEHALFRLLAQPASGREARALLGKGSAGHYLQKVWNETRIRKAIDTLLADTQTVPSDSSDNEQVAAKSDRPGFPRDGGGSSNSRLVTGLTTNTMQDSTDTPGSDRAFCTVLKLPPHWERLMAVFVSYTHCWLPVVCPEALRSLATSYGVSGVHVDFDGDRSVYSRHSELWAALAIAAFQDAPYSEYMCSLEFSASYIFRVARSLVPDDDKTFDLHNTSATILHSAILIGRGEIFPASLLLGKAARLLKRLQFSGDGQPCMSCDLHDLDRIQLDTAAIACSLLDTLTSLSINQHAVTDVCDLASNIRRSTAEFTGFDQIWQSVPSDGSAKHFSQAVASSQTMEPIHTLTQLYALTTVFHRIVYPKLRARDRQRTRPMGLEDLAQMLDARFNYCNSIVSSCPTPIMPSAFLIKLLFLTVTMEVASHLRSSLLSGFLETIESCFANFGAARTPPVVSLLLQILQQRAAMSDLSDAEQSSWHSAVHNLHDIWQDGPESSFDAEELLQQQQHQQRRQRQQRQEEDLIPRKAMISKQGAAGTSQTFEIEARPISHPGPGSSPGGPFRQSGSAGGNKHAAAHSRGFGYQRSAVPNPGYAAHVTMPPAAQAAGGGRVSTHLAFSGGHRINQNFDYGALFEDLGSARYTDTMEMDARFITNLGFEPGCDLGEMFEGDCGV